MELHGLVDTYLARRKTARLAASTIGLYRRHLTTWIADRQQQGLATTIAAITLDELTAYFAQLAEQPTRGRHRKPNTLASVYRVLRAFWRWAAREQLLTPDQATYFQRLDAPHVPREARRAADTTLYRQLLEACGDPQAGGVDGENAARNRALLALLYESGARISEVCNLTDGQLDHRRRRASIVGKGEKSRPIFWGPGAAAAIAQYLLVRRGPRGGSAPVFRGTSIRNPGGKLTTDAARSAIKRLAAAAGVELPKGAPFHAFRHGFARRARRNGADISDIKDLLGHADISTTMIYLAHDEDELAESYERIFGRSATPEKGRRDGKSRGG